MKKILITGGSGFLGSHLCDTLLSAGNHVVCLSQFRKSGKSNISHLLEKPGFRVLEHDITDPLEIEIDEIYNLACPASPVQYRLDPVHTVKTSIVGASNMLELARRNGAKILQASTSEVYGDPEVNPQPESYWGRVNPVGRTSCYVEGKRCAETLFYNFHLQHGLDVKIARIFNTYGPRMSVGDGRVMSNFIVQALRGDDVTVFGDGEHTRSFCYVSDLIDGLVRLMAKRPGFTGPVNIGAPEEITMLELACKVIDQSGSSSRIRFQPIPIEDPVQRCADIRFAQEELGWEPKVEFSEGLRRTVDYFRKKLTAVGVSIGQSVSKC